VRLRRFLMENWLAEYKDSCPFNLGESGMPDVTVGELLSRCGETTESISELILKDNDTRGTERLRSAISATYGNDINSENITVTTGTSEALFILFCISLEQRTSVVVPFPSFQALYEVPRALGAQLKFYHLDSKRRFIPEPDEVCSLIDDTTGMVVINTPHNPSGGMLPDDVAGRVLKKAAFHGAMVIVDEHYRFLPVGGNPPITSFARPDENIIATGSITKCFGLVGLRMGWIVAPQSLIHRIRDFRDYITHTLSPVSDFLAAVALENAPAFLENNCSVIRKNRSSLEEMIQNTYGLSLIPPQGGAVAFPRYDYQLLSEDFTRGLIQKHGVFVLPGNTFEVENHFRLNIGQPPALFQKALTHIHDFCLSLEKKCSG